MSNVILEKIIYYAWTCPVCSEYHRNHYDEIKDGQVYCDECETKFKWIMDREE